MRLRHKDGTTVHLAYGTNVHPAEDVDGVIDQIRRFGEPVRNAIDADLLGLGLWLPATAIATLASDRAQLDRLRRSLDAAGLEVVTLNAFPYAGFHAPVVKQAVYRPDWTELSRLDYTLDCAEVLAALLPDDAARGSISTLPLGWRSPWTPVQQKASLQHLDRLAEGLAEIRARTGKLIRVAIEPEPGCVIETIDDAGARLGGLQSEHVGICLDTCHLSTSFEDIGLALATLDAADLPIVKSQLSAALHVDTPSSDDSRTALARFAEDRFLHQVREQVGHDVIAEDDLPDALAGSLPGRGPWRVHFHVPLHQQPDAPLRSTQAELVAAMAALVGGDRALTDHLEVETYTWSVLPEGRRPQDDEGLVAGLAAELRWASEQLETMGLRSA